MVWEAYGFERARLFIANQLYETVGLPIQLDREVIYDKGRDGPRRQVLDLHNGALHLATSIACGIANKVLKTRSRIVFEMYWRLQKLDAYSKVVFVQLYLSAIPFTFYIVLCQA